MADYPDHTTIVDVLYQSLAALAADIDIIAQSTGVHTEGEWEALQGNELVTLAGLANIADGGHDDDTYTVPAGKTFYLNWCTAQWHNDGAGARPNVCIGYIELVAGGAPYVAHGGNGGMGITFPTPVPFAAGTTITMYLYNYSGNQIDGTIIMGGYLL